MLLVGRSWPFTANRMKALVLAEYNRLEIQELPDPQPGPGEVLVEVRACGICGSDVHGMDGSTGRRIPPIVMGHEAAGVVAAVGPGVSSLAAGDRVTFDSMVWCGACGFCRRGAVNLCQRRQVLGVSCPEFRRPGAFAQLITVPERIVYRLPEGLSFEKAALTEPLSVAVHAVRLARVELNESAAVIGSGVIGLLVIEALKAAGCGRIIAVDLDQQRLALASRLGAAETLSPAEVGDVAAEIQRRTSGQGADLAVEAVGVAQTVSAAVHAVRKGGRVVLLGNLSPQAELPLQAVVTRELRLQGSCASAGEYPDCLEMIARGAIQLEPLISAIAPLEEGPRWFERLRAGQQGLLKVILRP